MENCEKSNNAIITKSYKENFNKVLNYISSRINNVWDAENLAQDVWVRLLTCGKILSPETITSYIYTIARNLVNDYLRHLYHVQDAHDELAFAGTEISEHSPESAVAAKDIADFERRRVECLPPQRRIIYIMSRFEDKSVDDIASELSLSFRTVENHLRMGRRDVREYIAAIA